MSMQRVWQEACLFRNGRKIGMFWDVEREKVQGLTKTLRAAKSTTVLLGLIEEDREVSMEMRGLQRLMLIGSPGRCAGRRLGEQ